MQQIYTKQDVINTFVWKISELAKECWNYT